MRVPVARRELREAANLLAQRLTWFALLAALTAAARALAPGAPLGPVTTAAATLAFVALSWSIPAAIAVVLAAVALLRAKAAA